MLTEIDMEKHSSLAIYGQRFTIEHDGFTGTVIGSYVRLDGYQGVVLQQDGTRVVHVYGEKHLRPAPPLPELCTDEGCDHYGTDHVCNPPTEDRDDEMEIARSSAFQDGYEHGRKSVAVSTDPQVFYRHKDRGTMYELIGIGKMQAGQWRAMRTVEDLGYMTPVDMCEVAIYRDIEDGSLWARPREEFEDGRFDTVLSVDTTPTENRAWEEYRGDFNSMTDEEVEREVSAEEIKLEEAESWLEAVASWKAAGKPRHEESE